MSTGSDLPIPQYDRIPLGEIFWIAYGDQSGATNQYVTKGVLYGPPGYYLILETNKIAVPDGEYIDSLVAAPNNSDIAYMSVHNGPTGDIKVYKLKFSDLSLTAIYTTNFSAGYISGMFCQESKDLVFAVTNPNDNLHVSPMGVYRTGDGGDNIQFLGSGNSLAELYNVAGLVVSTTLSTSRTRIITQHSNPGSGVALSYTDNLGVTWIDYAGSCLGGGSGSWGYVELFPNGSGLDRIYYSCANGGGGISTPYIENSVVTLNPEFHDILDSTYIESGFVINSNNRIAIAGTNAYMSSDKGASWTATIHPLYTCTGKRRQFNLVYTKDWFVYCTSAANVLIMTVDYGATFLYLNLPAASKAIGFINGR